MSKTQKRYEKHNYDDDREYGRKVKASNYRGKKRINMKEEKFDEDLPELRWDLIKKWR